MHHLHMINHLIVIMQPISYSYDLHTLYTDIYFPPPLRHM
jgi:hypothetical protein